MNGKQAKRALNDFQKNMFGVRFTLNFKFSYLFLCVFRNIFTKTQAFSFQSIYRTAHQVKTFPFPKTSVVIDFVVSPFILLTTLEFGNLTHSLKWIFKNQHRTKNVKCWEVLETTQHSRNFHAKKTYRNGNIKFLIASVELPSKSQDRVSGVFIAR